MKPYEIIMLAFNTESVEVREETSKRCGLLE